MTETEGPTFIEMCDEVLTLIGGLVAALLPFILLSAPAIIPLAVFGGVVAAVLGLVVAVLGLLLAGPVLLVRMLLRRLTRDEFRAPATS